MNKRIFLPVVAVITVLMATAGAVGIGSYVNSWSNGHVGIGSFFGWGRAGTGNYVNYSVNAHSRIGASSIFGSSYQNISYNNANTINRTTVLEQIGTVAQCRTNFVNTAVPIVATATKSNLNATEVDQANTKLQSDITSNASNPTIRSDVFVFDGSMVRLYGQAIGDVQVLNQTQLLSLKTQLNSSVQTLQTCTSGNGFGKWSLGFRGFWNGFVNWWHLHLRFHT